MSGRSEMEIVRQRKRAKNGDSDKERKNVIQERAALRKKRGTETEGGLVEGNGRGGVSNITLMNQCQWSDEKIIKKQACAVLNTAKGKRPIVLYRNTIWTRKKNCNKWQESEKWGRENPYHRRCPNALQMAL